MVLNFVVNKSNTTQMSKDFQGITVPVGKAISAIVMFVAVIIVIYIPVIVCGRLDLSRQRNSFRDRLQLWIGRLSCFAGGVFLSTGFMDIFPDVIQSINEAGKKLNIKITFPLASFFTLIGFFLILSIEQITLIYQNHLKKLKQIQSKNRINVDEENCREEFLPSFSSESLDERFPQTASSNVRSDFIKNDKKHFQAYRILNKEEDNHENIFRHSKSRIFALMFAMSIHAVFEGLAIGLGTTVTGVTQLFAALLLHKLIIAGSLGLNLVTADLKMCVKLVVSLIFALGSPLGILLGLLIISQEKSHNTFYMVGGILEGIACGTFMYVVFFEILPHEMGHEVHEDRGAKLISLILGFIFFSVCLLIIPMI